MAGEPTPTVNLDDPKFQAMIRAMLAEMLTEFVRGNEERVKELALIERIVRVEEELKALRKIEAARFEAMEKRFEALQREMDKRFEALQREMDKRFEAMDKRFEAMDKRFEAMDKRFEAILREMNTRFEAMERRFEALQREMDKRFESLERRLTFTQWMIGVGFALLGLILSLR